MLPGLAPLAVAPVSVPLVDVSVRAPLRLLFEDPDADLAFLLVGYPLDVEAADSSWPYPVADAPVASLSDIDAEIPLPLYLADRTFFTEPDDDPPNQIFSPRLVTAYTFESSIPLPGAGEARGSTSYGATEIANPDGDLDKLLNSTLVGRLVEIKVGGTINRGRAGETVLRYSEYGTLIRGTVDGTTWTDTRVTLPLRDNTQRLEQPVQTENYAGTGGAEGDDSIAGQPKPLGWGFCQNVPPPLVYAARDVYQLAGGPIHQVVAVRDKGQALDFCGTDYPSFTALTAATRGAGQDIEPGEYATCLAEGLVGLGAPAEGQVTVDFRGDAEDGYVATAAEIARRIAVRRGGLLDPDEIDAGAIAALAAARPAEVGIWTGTDQVDMADILDQLLGSIDGWWLFTRDGRLTMGVHVDPDAAPAVATITENQVVEGSVQRLATPEPVYQYRLGYRHLYAVQSADSIVGSAADRQAYGKADLYATAAEPTIREVWKGARSIELTTLLAAQADAQAEAARRLARDKRGRDLLQIVKKRDFLQHRPGDVVNLRLPILDLDEGRDMLVISVAEDATSRSVTLQLWG